MGTIMILPTTPFKPITLIGERAGVCWGADTSDDDANYRRGMDCIRAGHGRVMEYVNIEMVLDGYSARVMREWYTHIGGMPTRLQASTRYIDYGDFEYVTPPSVERSGIDVSLYDGAMAKIREIITALVDDGVPREDAAMLLPMGMKTRVVDKRNLRSLVDMSRQRTCQRAFWEYRELFADIVKMLSQYSEEWQWIAVNLLHPKCEDLGYCPEKHGCGLYPKRE